MTEDVAVAVREGRWRAPAALRGAAWWEIALVVLHPLVLPLTTAWRLAGVARSLAPLAREPWSGFGRMSAVRTLGGSWHRAYDLFWERYGRWGYAYEMGLGAPMGPLFFLTKASIALFRHAECVVPWLGMVLMLASQTVWIGAPAEATSVLAVIALGAISTLFYFAAFEALKYDALGWALVPLGYWALANGNLWLFALVMLAIACLSVSAAIAQGAVWAVASLLLQGPVGLIGFLPAGLKLLTHFRFLTWPGGWQRLRATATGIGALGAGARRRRLALGRVEGYLLLLWGGFLVAYAVYGAPPPAPITKGAMLAVGVAAVSLFAVNQGWRRFADVQTVCVLVFVAFGTMALLQPLGWLHLLYLIAISPVPYVLGFTDGGRARSLFWCVPERRPYRVAPLRRALEPLVAPLGPGDRVLFDYPFEAEAYPRFGGLRAIKEYLHFLALERGAAVVPDFYLVFQSFAGLVPLERLYGDRSPAGLRRALETIGGRFVLHPSAQAEPEEAWREAGFVTRGSLDLAAGEPAGLWGPEAYPPATSFLHLLEAEGLDAELVVGGSLIERAPNRMRLRLGEDGEATVRFAHDPGWHAAGARLRRAEGPFPWIVAEGPAGAEISLAYDARAARRAGRRA